MLRKWLLGNERQEVAKLAKQRTCNSSLIDLEKARLQQEVIQSLCGKHGLALSFGAGCATALAYKNREHLTHLQGLPWEDIIQVATEYGALVQYAQADASGQ